ncbi:hypothetical protein MAR_001494 [Mya arenaria]|uniref:Uncharacterized protein n=1 Tax=Mya arenaria TaxID=6604 RepID=A0ABY7FFZ2_MYAAR|nr:hypothetical protein MAR_001494 [Mya arenaria]
MTIEHVQAKMASENVVMTYFANLVACIQNNGLAIKKGVQLKSPHIVANVEHPAQAVSSGKGNTLTTIGAGSVIRSAIPSYFVIPGKRICFTPVTFSSLLLSGAMDLSNDVP